MRNTLTKIIEVIDRQTLYDVAVQEYGSVEGVFALLQDNSDQLQSITSFIVPGTLLKISQPATDKDTLTYFQTNKYKPVTLTTDILNNSGGEYNDDYFIDYD